MTDALARSYAERTKLESQAKLDKASLIALTERLNRLEKERNEAASDLKDAKTSLAELKEKLGSESSSTTAAEPGSSTADARTRNNLLFYACFIGWGAALLLGVYVLSNMGRSTSSPHADDRTTPPS